MQNLVRWEDRPEGAGHADWPDIMRAARITELDFQIRDDWIAESMAEA